MEKFCHHRQLSSILIYPTLDPERNLKGQQCFKHEGEKKLTHFEMQLSAAFANRIKNVIKKVSKFLFFCMCADFLLCFIGSLLYLFYSLRTIRIQLQFCF